MRSLPQRWARQYAYTTVPKSGLPSKIAPVSISLQGIQPGSGSRIAAEEMNELLAVMQEHVENTRFAGLTHWRALPAGFDDALATVRHPLTGEIWVSVLLNELRATEGTLAQIATAASAFGTVTDRAACERRDTAGNGSIVIFGSYASGVRARYTAAGSPTALVSVDLVSVATGMRDCIYDAVGACVIGFTTGSGADQRIVRFPDAVVVTSFATTAPTFVDVNGSTLSRKILASGGGTTLLVYGSAAGNFNAYRSTNAGVTFAASTAPTGSGSPTVRGLFHVEDFIGLGPRFVCATHSTTGGHMLHHSADGSVWTTITPHAFVQALPASVNAIVIGSSVIYAGQAGPIYTLWDVARNTVTAHQAHSGGPSRFFFVGGRLFARSEANNSLLVSGQLTAPPTTTLGRMSD